jgi:hypothetical protein
MERIATNILFLRNVNRLFFVTFLLNLPSLRALSVVKFPQLRLRLQTASVFR